jgi:hypothetical protein
MSKIEIDTKELIESLIERQGVAETLSDFYDAITDKLGSDFAWEDTLLYNGESEMDKFFKHLRKALKIAGYKS